MKNQLMGAITYMESIGVELDLFYSIRKVNTQTTFQGYYNQEIARILISQGYANTIDNDGFITFSNKDGSIKVVFS